LIARASAGAVVAHRLGETAAVRNAQGMVVYMFNAFQWHNLE